MTWTELNFELLVIGRPCPGPNELNKDLINCNGEKTMKLKTKNIVMDRTDKINNNAAIGESSGGTFEESVPAIRLVICFVLCDGFDVVIVSDIHSGIAEYEEASATSLLWHWFTLRFPKTDRSNQAEAENKA